MLDEKHMKLAVKSLALGWAFLSCAQTSLEKHFCGLVGALFVVL